MYQELTMIKAEEHRQVYIHWHISRETRSYARLQIQTEAMTMSRRYLIGCRLMAVLVYMMPTGGGDLEEIFTETVVLMAALIFPFLLPGSFTKILRQAVRLYVFTDN